MAPGDVRDVARRLRELSGASLAAGANEDVVDAFLAAARELLNVDQVHLIEVSQDATVGHARVVAYEAGGLREDAYVMVLDERPSGTTRVVATGEVVHVPDAPNSTALRPDYTRRFGVRSALFVPLAWAGEVRWVTVLARTRDRPFADEEIELAQVLANTAAAGLALVEGAERGAATPAREAALARAAAELATAAERDTVLAAICREADAALDGDMAGVYLGDRERGGVATAGHGTPPGWTGYVMAPGEGIGGKVLVTGQPAISSAYQAEVRLPANPGLRDLRTAAAVPLRWNGEVGGALSVGWRRMRRVSPSDLRMLEAFADLAAVACRSGGGAAGA